MSHPESGRNDNNPERSGGGSLEYPRSFSDPVQRFFESPTEGFIAVDMNRKACEGLSHYVPVAERTTSRPIYIQGGGIRIDTVRSLGETRDARPVSEILNGANITDPRVVQDIDRALGAQANYVEDVNSAGGVLTEKIGGVHLLYRPHVDERIIAHTVAPDMREHAVPLPSGRDVGAVTPVIEGIAILGRDITLLQHAASGRYIGATRELLKVVEQLGRQFDGMIPRQYKALQGQIKEALVRGNPDYFVRDLPAICARTRAEFPGGMMQTRESVSLMDLEQFMVTGEKIVGYYPSGLALELLNGQMKYTDLERAELRLGREQAREGEGILRDIFGENPDDPEGDSDTGGGGGVAPEPPKPTPPAPGGATPKREEQAPEREARSADKDRTDTPVREADTDSNQKDSPNSKGETAKTVAAQKAEAERVKAVERAVDEARQLAESQQRTVEAPTVGDITDTPAVHGNTRDTSRYLPGPEIEMERAEPSTMDAATAEAERIIAVAEAAKAAAEKERRRQQLEQALASRAPVVEQDYQPTPERDPLDSQTMMANLLAQGLQARAREEERGVIDERKNEFKPNTPALDPKALEQEAERERTTNEGVAHVMRVHEASAQLARERMDASVRDLVREGWDLADAREEVARREREQTPQVMRRGIEQDGRGLGRTR